MYRPPSPPLSPPKNRIIKEGSDTPPTKPKCITDDNWYADSFQNLFVSNYAVSGMYTNKSPVENYKYKTFYRKCEYCNIISNVTYEINNCESCGAQFGLLDWLDSIRIAERIKNPGSVFFNGDISEYKSTAIDIISNAFKNHIEYVNRTEDIYQLLNALPDDTISGLMSYFRGFFKPDRLIKMPT